ncbi:MAG: 2Fe-2S iron-sulfur cluster-binding protein [Candidatus Thiodiazotropha sp.]
MVENDLIIIAAILVLALLSVGITLLRRRRKTLFDAGHNSSRESAAIAMDADNELYRNVTTESELDITITFSESKKAFRWIGANDSLLEFAESRGVEVECLCRAGECGSCRTKLIEGEVEYHQKPSINPGRGYCLLCISKPKSDLILER